MNSDQFELGQDYVQDDSETESGSFLREQDRFANLNMQNAKMKIIL